jgi:hypothetical protein
MLTKVEGAKFKPILKAFRVYASYSRKESTPLSYPNVNGTKRKRIWVENIVVLGQCEFGFRQKWGWIWTRLGT